jgi:2-polyprenyl-6-hydroxyphenyl methylase/3-demethylubiquinone-9 3-methyltransferase
MTNDLIARIDFDPNWPASLREAYLYDRMEIWGERFNSAYATYYAQRRRRTFDALLRHCPPPARLLDLAAASGNFSIAAAQLGYRVTWNDLRGEMADYVRLKAPKDAQIDYRIGNIFEFGDDLRGAFDVVLALEVIEHVAHPDEFLSQVAGFVRPGGILIISTPNGGYFINTLPRFSEVEDASQYESVQFKPNSDGHIFLLYEDEMRSMGAKAGLKTLTYEQFTNPLSAGHVKLRYLHHVMPRSAIAAVERMSDRLPARLKAKLTSASLTVYQK